MRFNTRELFAVVAVVAVLAAIIGGAIRGVNREYRIHEDRYAIWQTQEMLHLYIDENKGALPSSWDELAPYFLRTKNLGWAEDFDAHKALVDINFTLDAKDFCTSRTEENSTLPKLVYLKSHRNDTGWVVLEEVNRSLAAILYSRTTKNPGISIPDSESGENPK